MTKKKPLAAKVVRGTHYEAELYALLELIEETTDTEDPKQRKWEVSPPRNERTRDTAILIKRPGREPQRGRIPKHEITEHTVRIIRQSAERIGFDYEAAKKARDVRKRKADREQQDRQLEAEAQRRAARPKKTAPVVRKQVEKKWPKLEVVSCDVNGLYAIELLSDPGDGSHQDRPLSKANVRRFVDIIENGLWNPDFMAVDWYGHVINGRHRLEAITSLTEDTAVPCIIVFGCDPKMFSVFDSPKTRTGGDTLFTEGLAPVGVNRDHMASGLRMIHSYKAIDSELSLSSRLRRRTENASISEMARLYPEIYVAMERAKVLHGSRRRGRASYTPQAAIAFCFLAAQAWPDCGEALDAYLIGVTLGENVSGSDPRKALYNYMIDTPKVPAIKQLALLLKMWNFYCTKASRQQVRWNNDDPMPVPIAEVAVTLYD